ncbi:hypothetical protein GF336_03070 [Candidatus Woesearchaeota archaeon]|nr:hypothetical protein [Candidatus Woesearchaeota archaeon]
MSVEDIKKINMLAQELLDHGISASRDDAMKQAQEMLNKQLADSGEEKSTAADTETSMKADDSTDRMMNMVRRSKEYMDRELVKFRKEMETIKAEMNAVKQKVESINKPGPKPPMPPRPEPVDKGSNQQQNQQPQSQQQQPQQQEQKEESHPKRGNVNSEDVSIEKMFYYGNK